MKHKKFLKEHWPMGLIVFCAIGAGLGVYLFNAHASTKMMSERLEAWSAPDMTLKPDEIALTTIERTPHEDEKHVIAVVIDDMGVDVKRSARALKKLPAEVTFAYLPYAPHVKKQVADAIARDHEILVHMPMEASRATADPGPNYLRTDQPLGEVRRRVRLNLSAFSGYVGINNHMGSKFTSDKAKVEVVMDELRERKVMFLDSKTSPTSVGEKIARAFGLETTHRDVFLDHFEHQAYVADALLHAENIARKTGSAVIIGHPKDVTLNGLEKWIPTLKAKGIKLVSITRVTELRKMKKAAAQKVALVEKR